MSKNKIDFKIDTRLESYQTFYDNDWATKILKFAENTKMDRFVMDLCLTWGGIGYARQLPYIMMLSLKASLERHVNSQPALSQQIIKALIGRIAKTDFSDEKQAETYHRILINKLKEIEIEIDNYCLINPAYMDIEKEWNTYISDKKLVAFQNSLWNSEQNSYVGIYFAYEDFITRSIGFAKNDPNYINWDNKEKKDNFISIFNEDLFDKCINNINVNKSRWARNAIVHNGGRMSDNLRSISHGFEVIDDRIIILASNTTELFTLLKDLALTFVEEAIKKPAFKI